MLYSWTEDQVAGSMELMLDTNHLWRGLRHSPLELRSLLLLPCRRLRSTYREAAFNSRCQNVWLYNNWRRAALEVSVSFLRCRRDEEWCCEVEMVRSANRRRLRNDLWLGWFFIVETDKEVEFEPSTLVEFTIHSLGIRRWWINRSWDMNSERSPRSLPINYYRSLHSGICKNIIFHEVCMNRIYYKYGNPNVARLEVPSLFFVQPHHTPNFFGSYTQNYEQLYFFYFTVTVHLTWSTLWVIEKISMTSWWGPKSLLWPKWSASVLGKLLRGYNFV